MGRPLQNCLATFAKLLEDLCISVWRLSHNFRATFAQLLGDLDVTFGRALHNCWATFAWVLDDRCITVGRPLHKCLTNIAKRLEYPSQLFGDFCMPFGRPCIPHSPRKLSPAALPPHSKVKRRTRPRTDHREPNIESMHCFARCVDAKLRTQLCKEIEEQRASITTLTKKK